MKKLAKILSRVTYVIAIVAVLSGCATTGFDVARQDTAGVEQPWEAVAVGADLREIKILSVVVLPMNPAWIGDGIGYYTDDETGQKVFVRREVWRAFIFDGDVVLKELPALINRRGTHLFVLVPGKKLPELVLSHLLVVSGSSRFGLTVQGEITEIGLEDLVSDRGARDKFFRDHLSRIPYEFLVDFSPGTPAGDAFLRDVRERFPGIAEIGGKRYAVGEDVMAVAGVTNSASYLDRFISRGSLPIGPGVVTTIGAGVAMARVIYNLIAVARDTSLRGSFFEGKYTGQEVGRTMGYYLQQNRELTERLLKENQELMKKLDERRQER